MAPPATDDANAAASEAKFEEVAAPQVPPDLPLTFVDFETSRAPAEATADAAAWAALFSPEAEEEAEAFAEL